MDGLRLRIDLRLHVVELLGVLGGKLLELGLHTLVTRHQLLELGFQHRNALGAVILFHGLSSWNLGEDCGLNPLFQLLQAFGFSCNWLATHWLV